MALVEIGPTNARSDPNTGMRFYSWKGVEYPSVTTIRRMAGLSQNLHQWSITQVVNRAVDNNDDLTRMLVRAADPKVAAAAKTWLRAAAVEERNRAAAVGTRVHDAATSGTPLDKVGSDIVPFINQYRHWQDKTGFEVLRAEQQVFNLTKGYGGSFDLLGKDRYGDIHIVDIKSGKNMYPDHVLQCTAYALAEIVGENDIVDAAATEWLQNASRMSLLHLRPTAPEDWEWAKVKVTRENIVAFNGLLAFAKWAHANRTMATLLDTVETGAFR